MKKYGIIGTPPDPRKKGGPRTHLERLKRDGEQPQYTLVPTRRLPKLPKKKPLEKKK